MKDDKSKNNLSNWYDVILNQNNRCLKCSSVESDMVKVGFNLVFCNKCFTKEFIKDGEFNESNFDKWKKEYIKEYVDKEN